MIEEYINIALESAEYEIIADKEPYYGEVKHLPGVWASGKTLGECRRKLTEVIEGWILIRVSKGLPIPALKGHKIIQPKRIPAHV
jgi:predicted RNase H-like HicB family nuclease